MRKTKNTSHFDSVHEKNETTSRLDIVLEKKKFHVPIVHMRFDSVHEKNKNYFRF